MISKHDPLDEPLRLLRETSLAAGFDERLSERLAVLHRQEKAPVLFLRRRSRLLMLVAAITLPAGAAATRYYLQPRPTVASSNADAQRRAKPLGHLPQSVFVANEQVVAPEAPAIVATPAPPPHGISPENPSIPKAPTSKAPTPNATATKASFPNAAVAQLTETRSARTHAEPTSKARATAQRSRIEALDPFESRLASTNRSTTTPKSDDMRATLLNAPERGTSRTDAERGRESHRELNLNERRDHDRAQQARERIQERARGLERDRRGQ